MILNHVIINNYFEYYIGANAATAESIFAAMNTALESNDITWCNCVGVSVDNTSVNLGKRKSIMTRAVSQNPATYFMGCPCHIEHNMTSKGIRGFHSG